MVYPSKPDPSFASTRLTRNGHKGGPPLSQVGGRPTRKATKRAAEDPYSSDDSLKETGRATKRKFEPAIDDAPLGSSDDDDSSAKSEMSAINEPMRRTTWSSKDLSYVLKEADKAAGELKEADNAAGDLKKADKAAGGSPKERRTSLPSTRQSRNTARKPNGKRGPSIRRPTEHPNTKPAAEETDLFSRMACPKPRRKQACYGSSAKAGYKNIHGSAPLKTETARTSSSEPDDGPAKASASKGPQFKNPAIFMEAYSNTSIPASSREHEADVVEFSDEFEAASPLSSISSTFSVDIPAHVQEEMDRRKTTVTLCPVCELPVDKELLKSFKSIEKMGQQSRFCLLHRKKTAEEQWHERHYPTIDWESFKERIESHFAGLEDMLSSGNDSFYRKSLRSSARDRKKQGNLRLTITSSELEKISTGYYGARGARNMMEAIIARFAPKMRELALSDPLIQAAGVSGYIQAVLVPELTTMLVKEDMNVDDEGARDIIKSSMEIGDLLNEQPDDVVEVKDEDLNIDFADAR
ncbi:uncharacterized protein GIQ15_03387 [Arthroderma uncinatum]|uniref:uncharacterized protein n=1 Tax=Arthroderma uncinatum TaxID=74035 RepID=UPI00144AEC16|nr:uncharacterized protein GIQ15_03387 [Arthroderma uncinatum]KAF3484063.1 hypothetical protein GIQ15_03387 [Arthroderma uncinatum]